MIRALALVLAWSVAITTTTANAAPPTPLETLTDATAVLTELEAIPKQGIPSSLIADAQAIAVIPRVIKAGFLIGGRGGHGVVLVRGENGTWSEPTFVNIGGASVGFQAGVQATDLVLVFRNRKALERILDGKGKLTLGADAAVAAGPVGRQAQAGTDAKLKSEILSYSRSRGLFAGVALDGAILAPDDRANRSYRADPKSTTKALEDLLKKIGEMGTDRTTPVGDRPPVPPTTVPPTTVPSAPPPVRVPPPGVPTRP